MFSEQKRQIIEYGMLMDRYELVSLTCGNLAIRMPTGEILITPSGMMYEKMVEDDVIVCDIDGNIIEGDKKPSSDTPAILYIFKHRPDVNGVIHTHQPYATALSLIPDLHEFRVCFTGMANAWCGNVPTNRSRQWWTSSSSTDRELRSFRPIWSTKKNSHLFKPLKTFTS